MNSRYKYLLLMHLIIFMWGFTGILGKLIHLDSVVIVWYRVIIAMIALGIYMIFSPKHFVPSSKKSLLQILLIGLFVGAHWLTFYKSIQLSTASLGILCLSTTTLHVSWLEPLVMKRKFDWTEGLLSLVIVFGIFITTTGFSPEEYKALMYGLVSAVFAAIFAVYNSKLTEKDSATTISFYEMGSATLGVTAFLFFQGKLSFDFIWMTTSDFYWLLFLGIACTSFAFLATIVVMKHLGAFTVSLSINLEPIYTLVLAVFILHENQLLSVNFYVGAVLIILTVIANALIKGRQRKKMRMLH